MINYKDLIKNLTEQDFKDKKANLHIHTTFSDGEGDFDRLTEQAEKLGYKYISITDHNTMEGYSKSEKAASSILIPGVEFDVWCGYVFMHLLAYGADKENPELKKFFASTKRGTEWDIARLFSTRDLKKLIEAIHSAGGIAVLAHPACCWCLSPERFIKELVNSGLDGIEIYYPYPKLRGILKFHNEEVFARLADKYNLIKTGGTDCHGKTLS